MNVIVTYDQNGTELEQIRRIEKDVVAKASEEAWEFPGFLQLQAVRNYVKSANAVDVVYFEIQEKEDVLAAAELRSIHKKALIAIIAELDVSPAEYMKPDIMAASVLLRPLTEEKIEYVVQETVAAYLAEKNEDACFVVHNKEGSYHIPVSEILWFEARQKKIFLRTRREEIGFYTTLEDLMKQLPAHFLRIHKSYIANTTKVRSIRFSENSIYMTDGSVLPISRSYRTEVKQRL